MKPRSVLITGASTGIGASCAGYLATRGFRVFAGVRRPEDGERLKADTSSPLTPVLLDVVDPDSLKRARETIAGALEDDGLSALVNNAGISVSAPLEFVPLDDLRRQFEVNLFGHVAVTQAFLSFLRTARGRIVNMSSISGRLSAPFLAPYAMSKFALEAFSDALRRELHPWHIEVSCVEPGAIDTPIWNKGLNAPENQLDNAPAGTRELYGESMRALRKLGEKSRDQAIPAERVAKVVHHALTARRPRTRYLVGPDAQITDRLVRWLPDRWLDALLRRITRL